MFGVSFRLALFGTFLALFTPDDRRQNGHESWTGLAGPSADHEHIKTRIVLWKSARYIQMKYKIEIALSCSSWMHVYRTYCQADNWIEREEEAGVREGAHVPIWLGEIETEKGREGERDDAAACQIYFIHFTNIQSSICLCVCLCLCMCARVCVTLPVPQTRFALRDRRQKLFRNKRHRRHCHLLRLVVVAAAATDTALRIKFASVTNHLTNHNKICARTSPVRPHRQYQHIYECVNNFGIFSTKKKPTENSSDFTSDSGSGDRCRWHLKRFRSWFKWRIRLLVFPYADFACGRAHPVRVCALIPFPTRKAVTAY